MILRTYGCEVCGYFMEVELRTDQWNQVAPECPRCSGISMAQEFRPPAIGGSVRSRATDLALDIAEKDYGVADIQTQKGDNGPPKVRYQDSSDGVSSWGVNNEALSQAVAAGRETRLRHGSALDIIKSMPDLIEISKRRSAKVW